MWRTWCVRLTLLCAAQTCLAQSTAFTYQGRLSDGGAPAAGLHDLRFRLFDAPSGGAQVGLTQCVDNVNLSEGLFTLQVDFGQQFATPAGRFLEIEVRRDTGANCGSAGGFVVLAPRQALTAAPLANHAKSAFALDAADGSPSNAVFVDNSGNVGIGTTTPQNQFHVVANRPALRLQDDDSATSFALLDDSSPGQMRINKVADATISLIDINPQIVNGTSDVAVRFFRETNTAGLRRVFFHSGNNSAATSAVIGVGGQSSFFQLDGGNVGIGTATPTAKLEVHGDIRLGTSGQLSAPGGEENLRIVRGSVSDLGGVLQGSGWTGGRLSTGNYEITFHTPFAGVPSVTATSIGFFVAGVHSVSATSFRVNISQSETSFNFPFQFIAVGPR